MRVIGRDHAALRLSCFPAAGCSTSRKGCGHDQGQAATLGTQRQTMPASENHRGAHAHDAELRSTCPATACKGARGLLPSGISQNGRLIRRSRPRRSLAAAVPGRGDPQSAPRLSRSSAARRDPRAGRAGARARSCAARGRCNPRIGRGNR